ncbi:hypothetical protein TRVL_06564 [Trypanosoma vivax]|nr:hypothetical protein TRVL_06564 [Trypanosoma vivax]
MSLFDCDDDISSSSVNSFPDNDESASAELLKQCSTTSLGGKCMPTSGVNVSRFTLTLEEKQKADQRWREEAGERIAQRAGETFSSSGSSIIDTNCSRFQASVAEALRVRKEAREQVLLERLWRQRAAEANSEECIKKDAEVGVFVTPHYLAALKRQKGHAKPCAEGQEACTADTNVNDPLELYVKSLEERLQTASSRGSLESSCLSRNRVSCSEGCSENTAYPSLKLSDVSVRGAAPGDVTSGLGVHLPSSKKAAAGSHLDLAPEGAPDVSPPSVSASSPFETQPELALREVRESRKRRRADETFVAEACERFYTRALERICV